MRSRLYILLAMMLPALHCGAQGVVVPQHVFDSIANPKMSGDVSLVFDMVEINTGVMSEDDTPKDFVFTYRNKGNEPVVITRVETSCGCAVAKYSGRPIQPGEEGQIIVTYNPKGQVGKLLRRIFVYTNTSSARPATRLTLSGDVTPTADEWTEYPVVMGKLRAKRNSIRFGEVAPASVKTERIECVNSGQNPLRLRVQTEMMPAWLSFRTDPAVIEPGQIADMVVTVDGSRIPGNTKGHTGYVLILEGISGSPSQRSLQITLDVK